WRHVRDDEKNEDKSKSQSPGVPAALKGAAYEVKAVALPKGAARPLLLPFVLEDQLRVAKAEVAAARQQMEAKPSELARLTLAAAEAKPAWLRAVHAAESRPQDEALASVAAEADARRLQA